eukprot:Hpha_TRINITY_DN6316_c0_g1::TRINITY_DN6316_c0_g1_i1::g.145523::m.145523/K12486/SMAP; stromal membrane-associated protein
MPGRILTEKETQKRFEKILHVDGNRECFDCTSRNPRWASASLGIFLCMRCAGKHRGLGTHISKVKSVNMDKWDQENVDFMSLMGNRRAEGVYRGQVPPSWRKPDERTDDAQMQRMIQNVHDLKKYAVNDWQQQIQNVWAEARGGADGSAPQGGVATPQAPAPAPAPSATPSAAFSSDPRVGQIVEMTRLSNEAAIALLRRAGDVQRAVGMLFDDPGLRDQLEADAGRTAPAP